MNRLAELVIEDKVKAQFVHNRDIIEEALLRDCEKTDSYDRIYTKMLVNSMEISADISTKIILEILISLGVIGENDEKQIRKKIMSVIK